MRPILRRFALSMLFITSIGSVRSAAQFVEESGLTMHVCTPSPEIDFDRYYDSTAPCKWVEVMPAFKSDLTAYLLKNRRYPDSSLFRGEEGRVIVQFIVDTSGCVRDPEIVRSSTFTLLDLEALRVVQTMMHAPLWTPGNRMGERRKYFSRCRSLSRSIDTL